MRTTRLPLLILTTTLITHILIISGQVITGRASVSFLASLGTTAIPAFTDIHGLIMAACTLRTVESRLRTAFTRVVTELRKPGQQARPSLSRGTQFWVLL